MFNFIRTTSDGKYSDIAHKLHDGAVDFDGLDRSIFDKDTQKILNRYDGASVTYDFTFDITEDNAAALTFDILRPLKSVTGGSKLDLSAGADLKRQNQRLLRVHDSFAELLSLKYPQRFCTDEARSENGLYPITGKIDVEDEVFTFLSLNQSGNLDAQKDTGTAPAISDNIKFTTKFNGGLVPSYTISPIKNYARLSNFSLNVTGSREDIHQVIIVFSLPLSGINKTEKFSGKSILEQREREEALVARARNVELIEDVSRIAERLSQ